MYRVSSISIMVAGLCLMLGVVPGWAGPPNNDVTDARKNTAGGTGALLNNSTGVGNTAFGGEALQNNTSGIESTAFGFGALFQNTTGNENTAVGLAALASNSSGPFNTAVGWVSLFANTTGSGNVAIGSKALNSNTIASENTAVGHAALTQTVTGGQNTALGFEALVFTTGSNNIAVGSFAGAKLTSGDNNIYLGAASPATESNTMRLGQGQTRSFVAGVAGTALTGSQVLVSSTGQLGILASSARYKRDISAMGARSRKLLELRPVTFRYKQDRQRIRQYGLIAEEVAKVYPELVTRGRGGTVESVQYHELIPMLLNELQRQQRELTELKVQSAHLQAALAGQTAALKARSVLLEEATASLASR